MMRELTFFTSNQTKLAHARYLAEGRRIRIKGFRQRTYHAGYNEPRLHSRAEILKQSYLSALEQIGKARLPAASHAFILEDTSVRIDALSDATHEVPGVDIKYWMEDRTFESVDALLKAAGNDRGASVRSDILLHIPGNFAKTWGIDEEYLVFTSEQRGSIIDREHVFDSNPVYPWLDNRSFNKWFVPEGCDAPLGALPIARADQVDFRRGAFEQLFDFLETRRYFPTPTIQLALHFERKPNILLCGYTCSGKTTASQHLARRFGYLHVEASDFMHLSYYYRHGFRGPTPIGDFAERALAEKPTIAAEKAVEYMLANLAEPLVISGFRAPAEVTFLDATMRAHGKEFTHYFVEADEASRFARLRARARPGDDLDAQEFHDRDLQQQRMGLDAIQQLETMQPLSNHGDLATYLAKIDLLVGDAGEGEIDIAARLTGLPTIGEIGLQDAILIALLRVWEEDETRRFYTTTEIAALISGAFPAIHPKHKDNVSRYFNQDFYAYYEISEGTGAAARKYRLSNTGYGMSIRVLRDLASSRR
ncbi:conserved hypothetical protein [Magnetospirillum sp. LM-5]|uniref:non-canonical purine NTP pyrophosphatase n=1 Tax=Magnetospirillum sp. LM-5 TaxID=2681466 RepID=UPI001383D220|nr:non-canonical purine NTP pyrophosphatase [Magnetospirillum sp. LM-5]CAA7614367.1 conserved hypothetical protein [Magnetospirillum sp. LM-5]